MQPAASAADGAAVKRVKGEVSGDVLPNEEKSEKGGRDTCRSCSLDINGVSSRLGLLPQVFSRKNCRQLAQTDQDENSEGVGSEGPQDSGKVSDEDGADNEHEADEEGSSAAERRMPYGRCEHRELSASDSRANCQAMHATMSREIGDQAFLEENDDDEPLSDRDAASNSSAEGEEALEIDSDGNKFSDGDSLAEGSDDDDLVAVDGIPNGLIGSDAESEQSDEEWGGISGGDKRKRRKDKSQAKCEKRKTLLPTSAPYEGYAKTIEEGPEDEI